MKMKKKASPAARPILVTTLIFHGSLCHFDKSVWVGGHVSFSGDVELCNVLLHIIRTVVYFNSTLSLC